MKNLSEVCQFPVLTCYQNPTTGRLEVIGDKFTVAKVKDDQNMLKKLDLYLSLSVESGESFTFADMKEFLDDTEKLSSCPLPTLKYKMFSEYKQFKESSHLYRSNMSQ